MYFNYKIKYGDLMIGSLDQKFIDDLSEKLKCYYRNVYVDVYNKEIICNQVIRGMYEDHISRLEIPDDLKERLKGRIWTNSLDSKIDDNIDNYPEEYHNELQHLF